MKHRRVLNICIGLMLCIILSPFVSIGQQTQNIINNPYVASNIKLLDAWLQTQIRYGKIPGVSVGIVYKGELIYQKGFSYADTEKKIPATPNTRYRIASQTKLFTAIGIMILRDEGKLNLDDPIEKYLTWLKLKPYNATDPPVTIRQLLSHASGLSRDNSWYESYVIFLGGKLQIVNPNSPDPKSSVWTLEPISTNRFRIVSSPRFTPVGEELLFRRNDQGKVISYLTGDGWASVKME